MTVKGVVATAVTTSAPVIWSFLGYPYEGASMLAGLAACAIVRVYVGFQGGKTYQEIVINLIVTLLTLLFTAGVLLTVRPQPFYAIIIGTGIGSLGATLIKFAEKKVRRLFDEDEGDVVVSDDEAIRRLSERIKDLP